MAEIIQIRRDNLADLVGSNTVLAYGEMCLGWDPNLQYHVLKIGDKSGSGWNDLKPFTDHFRGWPGQLGLDGDAAGTDDFSDNVDNDEFHYQPGSPAIVKVKDGLTREVTVLFDRALAHIEGEEIVVWNDDDSSFDIIIAGLGDDGTKTRTLGGKNDSIKVRFNGTFFEIIQVMRATDGSGSVVAGGLVLSSRPVETADFDLAESDFNTIIHCEPDTSPGMIITLPSALIDVPPLADARAVPVVQVQSLPGSAGPIKVRSSGSGGGTPFAFASVDEYLVPEGTLFDTWLQSITIAADTGWLLVDCCYQANGDNEDRHLKMALGATSMTDLFTPGTADEGRWVPGFGAAYLDAPTPGDHDLTIDFDVLGTTDPATMKSISVRVWQFLGSCTVEGVDLMDGGNASSIQFSLVAAGPTDVLLSAVAQQQQVLHDAGGWTVDKGSIESAGALTSGNTADRHTWAAGILTSPVAGSNTITWGARGVSDGANGYSAVLRPVVAAQQAGDVTFLPIPVPEDVLAGEAMELQIQGSGGYVLTSKKV